MNATLCPENQSVAIPNEPKVLLPVVASAEFLRVILVPCVIVILLPLPFTIVTASPAEKTLGFTVTAVVEL